jgi:hypothetical protein
MIRRPPPPREAEVDHDQVRVFLAGDRESGDRIACVGDLVPVLLEVKPEQA